MKFRRAGVNPATRPAVVAVNPAGAEKRDGIMHKVKKLGITGTHRVSF